MTSASSKIWIYSLLFTGLAALTAGGIYLIVECSSWTSPVSSQPGNPQERYYRAVYLLQSFGGPAVLEQENIPRRIAYTDTTEDLLHHPDRILVLRHIADELSQLHADAPKAAFFEACARLALGERRAAVNLLTRYVIDNEYDANHYAILCDALYGLEDYPSLLLICREWQERDPSCREDRLRHGWAALHNLGRYPQAVRYMQTTGACLGWRAAVYEAKSTLSHEGEARALPVLEQATQRYQDNAPQILRLWDIIKGKNRV